MNRFFILLFLSISILIVSCQETSPSREKKVVNTIAPIADTSNQYIYDFMKVVIQDQNLNYGYGLSLTPELSIGNNENDKSFLMNFLIEKEIPKEKIKKSKEIVRDSSHTVADSGEVLPDTIILISPSDFQIDFSSSYGNLVDKCLTEEDISYMLSERERLKDFKWDNHRLGFNLSNENNWYVFSLPYFSKDRKVVMILVRDLCKPFLCGGGYTLVFKLEGGCWTSSKVSSWIH